MEAKKNIVLLDDHVIIRNGLKELIEKLGPFIIARQFDNGAELIAESDKMQDVDLIISDINMPGMNGDAVVEKLKEKGIKIPVLMLTVSEDEETMIKLFRLGVRGYLKKNCKSAELKNALEQIFESGYYHNEFLAQSLQTAASEKKKSERELVLERLSPKEKEFLKLVCDIREYTYDQIADKMNLQHRTVDGYRESIFTKFKIKSKTGLVLFVLKHKLLDDL